MALYGKEPKTLFTGKFLVVLFFWPIMIFGPIVIFATTVDSKGAEVRIVFVGPRGWPVSVHGDTFCRRCDSFDIDEDFVRLLFDIFTFVQIDVGSVGRVQYVLDIIHEWVTLDAIVWAGYWRSVNIFWVELLWAHLVSYFHRDFIGRAEKRLLPTAFFDIWGV
jgi:hypothetical protein